MTTQYISIRLTKKELEQLLWALDNCDSFFPVQQKLQAKMDEMRDRWS